MAACSEVLIDVWGVHAHLMAYARGNNNDNALACMIATWSFGGGALPARLGLPPDQFENLLAHHFPGARVTSPWQPVAVRSEARSDEIDELQRLMLANRAGQDPSEAWLAAIVASACMGDDHLWQDLGLWCRADLTALMRGNFPGLAARNDRDMKWKKFLYKQLCETEGIYACRSPSCAVCVDYANCFGTED